MASVTHKVNFWSEHPKVNSLFRSVACVYNHERFYANIQINDAALHLDFNFQDLTKWKAMNPDFIKLTPSIQQSLSFMPNSMQELTE